MIALIDLDSVLYKAVYKVVSITQMRQAIALHGKEGAKQWLYEEVYEQGINRVEKQVLEMLEHLESVMFEEISSTELFITTCTNSSPDKDLKTIGGLYWSYYKEDQYDFEGNVLLDDNGFKEKDFKQREPIYITQKEADLFFWQQVLSGDKGDCIDGINAITATHKKEILKERGVKVACRVGVVTAEKILADSTNHFIRVAREYIIRGQKNQFKLNYSLLKLGSVN